MLHVLVLQGEAELAGAERVLLALLSELQGRDVRVTVAFADEGPVVGAARSLGLDTVLRPGARLRQPIALARSVMSIRRLLRTSQPDVVQATGEKMAIVAGWSAYRTGIPVIAWLHDSPAQPGEVRTAAVQRLLAATPLARVVTCSAWMAEAFGRRLRAPVEAIHNGIDLPDVPPGERRDARAAVLAEYGWPDDALVVSHVARLERWKGADVFLRAAGAMAEAGDLGRIRFLVVGGALYGRDATYAAGLPALAGSVGLGDRVAFAGQRADAPALMAASDVVVHASVRAEPFGMVLLEAMAAGVAVVATRTGGPEEIVEDGVSGLLVAPNDPAALAAAIGRLARDDALRGAIAKAAPERARRFPAAAMAESFVDLWHRTARRAAGEERAA